MSIETFGQPQSARNFPVHECQEGNCQDAYTVAVKKNGNIVGHIPRKISTTSFISMLRQINPLSSHGILALFGGFTPRWLGNTLHSGLHWKCEGGFQSGETCFSHSPHRFE